MSIILEFGGSLMLDKMTTRWHIKVVDGFEGSNFKFSLTLIDVAKKFVEDTNEIKQLNGVHLY